MVNFPKPRIPTSPVLSLASFSSAKDQHVPSVLDAGGVRLVTSGKRAIALALQQMKIGKNGLCLRDALVWNENTLRYIGESSLNLTYITGGRNLLAFHSSYSYPCSSQFVSNHSGN